MSIILIAMSPLVAVAQDQTTDTISVSISFKRGYSNLDLNFMGNKEALDGFLKAYEQHSQTSDTIYILGYASPEGAVSVNQRLSRERANVIANYLHDNCNIHADSIVKIPVGVDWQDLYTYVLADLNVPAREQVLDIIQNVTDIVHDSNGLLISQRNKLLKRLENGRTWSYMLKHIYPKLRGSKVEMVYVVNQPEPKPEEVEIPTEPEVPILIEEPDTVVISTPQPISTPTPSDTLYWSLHTNTLYDLLAIPNIGAELYLGKNFSIAANWWYAWWKNDHAHRYWRTYGGYIAPRYWIGKAAKEKPLTGHHVGLYAQVMLYDFEWGGTGYLSGTPYKNISHRPTWGGGIEYGFALPIQRHLNIDFTIGLGYLKGRYWKYVPLDDGYRWISVNNLNWWGPTKCEVSLVWLLGEGNRNNIKKGGRK